MLEAISFNEKINVTYDKIVVFLHGLGSNSEDLMSLAPELHRHCKNQEILFLSVNAPYKSDFNYHGYQWFSLKDWDEKRIYSEIELSSESLRKYLEKITKLYNLTYDKIFLIGFSQGAMMSLHLAPRLEKEIGGVIALSGRLLGPEKLANNLKSRPKIMLNHGRKDEIVDFKYMEEAKYILERNNFSVEAHSNNAAHTIDFECLEKIKNFLAR